MAETIEEQLTRDLAGFFADPEGFVLYAFAWGEGELEGIEGPDDWQRDVLREVGELVAKGEPLREAIAAGHGIGKGALTAMLIIWLMSTRAQLAGVVTANTKAQLTGKTWRELQVWHRRLIQPLRTWFEWQATRYQRVTARKTWGVDALPWTEAKSEAFQGLHARDALVIFDEASAIPDKIWDAAEGSMTTEGAMWFVFGNPTRPSGRFHRCFHRDRHRWQRRQIDSRTVRFTDKAQLQRWVEDYGEDSDFVRVRVRGLFPRAGATQLISHELVEAARLRAPEPDPGAALVMAVDVARFGDDKSVIAFREGRDARGIPWKKYRGLDLMTLAGHVGEQIERWHPDAVFVEGDGVGGGLVDRLRQLRFRVIEVTAGAEARDPRRFRNRRAEMWGEMAEWLKTGSIGDDPELAEDLTGPEYSFDLHQRLVLERKEDMKARGLASPDEGDALALTFAERVARKDLRLGGQLRPKIARTFRPNHGRGAFA